MKELFSNTKITLERLITLLIPGSIALVPFFWLAYEHIHLFQVFIQEKEGLSTTLMIIVSVACGMVLEDIGSRIELLLERIRPIHDLSGTWETYLKLNLDDCAKIVGQGYLESIYARMKFELSFAVAICVGTIGLNIMRLKSAFLSTAEYWWVLIIALPVLLILYMLFEAWSSSRLLHKNRKRLCEALCS